MDSVDGFHPTDEGNALRFIAFFEDKVKHISEGDRFIRWEPDGGWYEANRYKLAKEVVDDLYNKAITHNDKVYALKCANVQTQRNMLLLAGEYSDI